MPEYECKVTTHGERQLELDVAYPLVAGQHTASYQLDLYIFSSFQLGMTEERYGVVRFLQDIKSYTRYTAPDISIGRLADPRCSVSPLVRISEMIDGADTSSDLDTDSVLYELRMLTNIYQHQLQHTTELLIEFVRSGGNPADAVQRLTELLSEVDGFLDTFRVLRTSFLDPRVTERLRESLRWSDEAISLSTEQMQYQLYELCSGRDDLIRATQLLRPRLEREKLYRKSMGYPTVLVADEPVTNEMVVYRESILKKWAEGCMYMSTIPAQIGRSVAQVLMAMAAGTAAVVAVGASLLATKVFPRNTVPWLVLIVVVYMLKDRIKAVSRSVFMACLPRLVADHVEDLTDPAVKRKVGRSRARVRFCNPSNLPETIVQYRNAGGNAFRDILPPENVIHFHKDVRINCARLRDHHTRLASITEIMRFKLDSFLANMDNPVNTLPHVVDGKIDYVRANRVYHINMILRLSDKQGARQDVLFRYRVIANRDGIVRIEHL